MRLLALLTAFLLSAPAFAHDGAVTKDEVADFKDSWKSEKKQTKEIEKLARQWTAAWSKKSETKMHKVDFHIVEWRKEVMEELRAAGISTEAIGVDSDAPVQEKFRDLLVELREGQASFDNETAPKAAFKRKADLLALLVAEMQVRTKRQEHRYTEHKDELKGK